MAAVISGSSVSRSAHTGLVITGALLVGFVTSPVLSGSILSMHPAWAEVAYEKIKEYEIARWAMCKIWKIEQMMSRTGKKVYFSGWPAHPFLLSVCDLAAHRRQKKSGEVVGC